MKDETVAGRRNLGPDPGVLRQNSPLEVVPQGAPCFDPPFAMKVTTEQKETCIVDLHIELPPERFHSEWKSVGEEYRGLVTLPGFRKGKAPLSIVEKRYGREIEQEVTRKLIDAAVREAFTEQKLFPIQSPSVRDVTLEGDRSLRFSATIITRPEVNLPEYKGLEITVEKKDVTDADVEQFLEGLRGDLADFKTVEGKPVAMGDFAVLDYEGSIEGKLLSETYPDLQPTYSGRTNFWIKLCLLYTSPSPRDGLLSRMPSSA